MSGRILCDVYRTPKREGMYLFVRREEGLQRVPEALLARFGTPELALSFVLDKDRALANADPEAVRERLLGEGYYLQMPPPIGDSAVPDGCS
ncbi:MAG: YcgL domain-containing protein [Pseudomonadota bacterium]